MKFITRWEGRWGSQERVSVAASQEFIQLTVDSGGVKTVLTLTADETADLINYLADARREVLSA